MQKILDRSREYEQLVISHDPMYEDLVRAIGIVQEFIIKHEFIVYGGTAIDYALRLMGDKLYPDNTLPDLDFYAPDNQTAAYDLADILWAAGWTSARAIAGVHVETMRVDVGDNHFIADITYLPESIYQRVPTLEYNSIRLVHPMWQAVDFHSSLSFPYDDPPREVIANRWKKDVKRFGMLYKHYPTKINGNATHRSTSAAIDAKGVTHGESIRAKGVTSVQLERQTTHLPRGIRRYVLAGYCAYAMYYLEYTRMMESFGAEPLPEVIEMKVSTTTEGGNDASTNSGVTIQTPSGAVEIVAIHARQAAAELYPGAQYARYRASVGIVPKRVEVQSGGCLCAVVYSCRKRMLTVNTIEFGGKGYRTATIQYVLKQLLAGYILHQRDVDLHIYCSLMTMMQHVDRLVAAKPRLTPFHLSITTYGAENESLSQRISRNRILADIDNVPRMVTPTNYYPGRSKESGRPRPAADYSAPYFMEDGGLEPDTDAK